MDARSQRVGIGGWLTVILGVVIALIGLVLGVGGAQLALLSGSPDYLIAGLALVASGVLLARPRVAGAR